MLSLEKARNAVAASEAEAKKLSIAVTTAVVDGSGNILLVSRMDGALTVSPKFALAKAYSSGTLGMPTGDMAGFTLPGKPYYGLSDLDKKFTTMAGGLPIKMGNQLVGGIGVGGSYDTSQDVACAQAGLKALV